MRSLKLNWRWRWPVDAVRLSNKYPPGCLPDKRFWVCSDPGADPGDTERDYISHMALECLGDPRRSWRMSELHHLACCHHNLDLRKWWDRWMDEKINGMRKSFRIKEELNVRNISKKSFTMQCNTRPHPHWTWRRNETAFILLHTFLQYHFLLSSITGTLLTCVWIHIKVPRTTLF